MNWFWLTVLIIVILLCLVFTLLIASITLVERKLLSLVQRRVGPDMVGYRGRLQFIADAIKLLAKGILIPGNVLKDVFFFLPIVSICVVYIFWINFFFYNNMYIVDIEFNFLYFSIISILFSISVLSVGILSKNKYTLIASVRYCLVIFNLDFILSFLFLYVGLFAESFSTSYAILNQYFSFSIFMFSPLTPILVVSFFMEVGRTPFDFGESESELVSGYTTELSGFLFVLYYLGEYYHLLLFSNFFSTVFFGKI